MSSVAVTGQVYASTQKTGPIGSTGAETKEQTTAQEGESENETTSQGETDDGDTAERTGPLTTGLWCAVGTGKGTSKPCVPCDPGLGLGNCVNTESGETKVLSEDAGGDSETTPTKDTSPLKPTTDNTGCMTGTGPGTDIPCDPCNPLTQTECEEKIDEGIAVPSAGSATVTNETNPTGALDEAVTGRQVDTDSNCLPGTGDQFKLPCIRCDDSILCPKSKSDDGDDEAVASLKGLNELCKTASTFPSSNFTATDCGALSQDQVINTNGTSVQREGIVVAIWKALIQACDKANCTIKDDGTVIKDPPRTNESNATGTSDKAVTTRALIKLKNLQAITDPSKQIETVFADLEKKGKVPPNTAETYKTFLTASPSESTKELVKLCNIAKADKAMSAFSRSMTPTSCNPPTGQPTDGVTYAWWWEVVKVIAVWGAEKVLDAVWDELNDDDYESCSGRPC